MTAPASIAGVTTTGFQKVFTPADVFKILSLLADSAPFANSLTRVPTSRTAVAFPTASPSGFGWVGELDLIPQIQLNDSAVTVAVCKLAGILDISNEMISDSTVNITSVITQLLADSMGPELDEGLLHGAGGNEPSGIVAVAPVITADTLLDGVAAAVGSIGDAGGAADKIAMSATALAQASASVDNTGQMLYPGGFGQAMGLIPVSVPGLATPLVFDSRRVYLILNGQLSSVESSSDYHFAWDATSLKIKARVAAAVPVPAKAIRQLELPPPAGNLSVTATASTANATASPRRTKQ